MSRAIYLGIEVGGTKLQLALGHGDGRLLAVERGKIAPERGADGIRGQILGLFDVLLARHDLKPRDLGGVGIGFGGPVDPREGITTRSFQVDGWTSFPLAAWARDRLGIARVAVENDADLAALGESRHGAGRGFDPVLYVTIGSGIGGGLIVDGKIYRGHGGGAVEIGHLVVDEPRLDVGYAADWHGITVEAMASGWSIARRACERLADARQDSRAIPTGALWRACGGDSELIDAPLVAGCELEGDPICLDVMRGARLALARGLASAITLLAPRRIILGGGVSLLGDVSWLHPLREEVDRRVFRDFRDTFEIVRSELAEEVVLHGALELASNSAGFAF